MWLLVHLFFTAIVLQIFTLTDCKERFQTDPQKIRAEYEFPWNRSKVAEALSKNEFPTDFLFGVATAAYQIEGAWNVSDKGESIWDRLTHTRSDLISDRSNGDIATDSYHKYSEDIQLVKQIGAKAYRISLSWTRILPDGFTNRVSADGIKYYNNVINEMLRYGITPMVTIYHWDLPQRLSELGGWTNPKIVDWFEAYARVVFDAFGDRVKLWATMNEPTVFCNLGYAGTFAPAINQSGIADYLCGHHVLLAHARTYHLYDREFRSSQKGKIGLVESMGWYEPSNSTSIADVAAAERAYQFNSGWFTHAIYSAQGDYPALMKSKVKIKSEQQGYLSSRLPSFTPEQIKYIKGAADFLGLNFYTATGIRNKTYENMSRLDDAGIESVDMKEWGNSVAWVKNTPWALGKLLNRINNEFAANPDIYITENGYSDYGSTRDVQRTAYYHDHLQAILLSIQSGVNVRGYFAWSLLDNFEWTSGYDIRFGLFQVDFNDVNRKRTPKLSSKLISEIYTSNQIPNLSYYLQ